MKKILLLLIAITASSVATLAAEHRVNKAADGIRKEIHLIKEIKGKRLRHVTRASEEGKGVVSTLRYEQLPDMKTPRLSHQSFPSGNGIVVVGGRTTGFALTTTAEIYRNGKWQSIDIASPHDGAFSVELNDGRVMVGGGFSSNNGVGQSRFTDIYDPKTNLFSAGPNLSVARAEAKAINLNGKVYVSGNWYADDTVIDCYNGSKFSSVGAMNGHSNPYMLTDQDGNLIVLSSYDTKGQSTGLYTDYDGTKYFVGVSYNPATNQASLYGFPSTFSPMALTDDVRTTNYQMTQEGVNYYMILCSRNGKPVLYVYDGDDIYDIGVDLPVKSSTGATIAWRGGVFINKAKEEIYIIGTSGTNTNQSVHIISLSFEGAWTIASASGFTHNLQSASWTLMSDGRLACTGGSINDNTDAQRKAYIFAPPTAGETYNDTPGPAGSGPRLVVWKKSGEKVTYDLHDAPITTFSGDKLVIRTNKTTVTYPRKDVLRYTYEQVSATGIELQPGEREVQVNIDGDEVTFRGLKAGAVAKVYGVNGVLISQHTAVAGQPLTVSIKNRPSGVYIVKADTESIKLMKK